MLQEKIEKLYSDFIAKRTYTRWLDDEKRRESWEEAVDRYSQHFSEFVPAQLSDAYLKAIDLKKRKEVMGSMRALWAAGPALTENNFAGYNCAFMSIDSVDKFGELLYILMHGTGCGISVERQFVSQLPELPETIESRPGYDLWKVGDSKLGWKEAFDFCITSLYSGHVPEFDFSAVRPKGARLKTFGGRSSGPEPLSQLFKFTIKTLQGAKGRKLTSLECHDLCTMVGSCVVVGGVRRSALISFSNLSDQRMKNAKNGQFWIDNPQRSMANNSVAYTEQPDSAMFMEEWLNLIRSGSGERGIFNSKAARAKADKFGRALGEVRSNPCCEALLMDRQLCNLTEVVVRDCDTEESIKEKIESAVLLGCLQSLMTDFSNVHPSWKINAERERLLGVSLTGVCDSALFRKTSDKTGSLLCRLRSHAYEFSEHVAGLLGIVAPKQVTLVKPSGTISQLCNCASGIHPRYSDYYIRRVRVNAKDPVAMLLLSKGIPCHPEVGQDWGDYSTLVFEFPHKSPRGSLTRTDFTAIEQLEYWKMFNDNWCDGNPSVTIYVKEDEWVEVGAWVYKNWDSVCGLSFIPFDGGNYPLQPYEEITRDGYRALAKSFAKIDINFDTELDQFEQEDCTIGRAELACSGGQCEL